MLKNKRILVTGGTGSIGRDLITDLLKQNPDKIYIMSRGEYFLTKCQFVDDPRIEHIFIAIENIEDYTFIASFDIIINLAAMKHVRYCEENKNLSEEINYHAVSRLLNAKRRDCLFIQMSTDKAYNPSCWYGHTKLKAEHICKLYKNAFFIRAGNYIGSSGSVLEIYKDLINKGIKKLPCHNERSTRFWMTKEDVANAVLYIIKNKTNVIMDDLPSFKIVDLIKALNCEPIILNIKDNINKTHEEMSNGINSGIRTMTVNEIKNKLRELNIDINSII